MRRVARAADDGYEHELVPGLRASEDAVQLARELAWAAARLVELAVEPPGLYAEAAGLGASDVEEGLWLVAQVAVVSPLEGVQDPWASLSSVRTTWESGEVPDLAGIARGPRAATGTGTLATYRARAQRAGSQAAFLSGEASLTPQRRFDRAFERLAVPGLTRAPRYEMLVLCGRLGLLDAEPWSPALGGPADAATLAAKRVFGIGDTLNLHRRAAELVGAVGVPVAALDLALVNWARGHEDRIAAGSHARTAPEDDARIASILGVSPN